MDESALKRELVRRLQAAYPGGLFWRPGQGPYSGRAGAPDIHGLIRGRFVGIEAKAPGRYKDPADGMSPSQAKFGEDIQRAGGVYIVTDNADTCMEEVKRLFPTDAA